jgi:hypothetical protein
MKNIYKYIPSVVFTFIEVFIVLAVLDNSTYSDNGDVIAALVVIYATIRTLGISLGMVLDKITMGIAVDLTRIKERIRSDDEVGEEWNKISEGNKRINITTTKLAIRAIGVFVVYVMGLMALLN